MRVVIFRTYSKTGRKAKGNPMKNNTDKYLYYTRRASDFGDYGIVAALTGLILWIPVYGVLSLIVAEETARVLAPCVSFAPTIVFCLCHIYYSIRSWIADPCR